MDLTADLMQIQGILTSVEKTPEQLKKIHHIGGNESIVNALILELKSFLFRRNYINEKSEPNENYKKELTDIVTFLTLNSEAYTLEIKEFEHLTNIMPIVSKCVLVNIVVNLNLCQFYGSTLQLLPIMLSRTLVEEFIPCLKRKTGDVAIIHIPIIISEIIKKISASDPTDIQVREAASHLSSIVAELLLPISGIDPRDTQQWKQSKFYIHIGHCLYNVLNLLLICATSCDGLAGIIDGLIRTAINVVKAITIDVFCVWAEANYKGEVLQMKVGCAAFHVIEQYIKYKPAKELVGMLNSIAIKPKTLQEQILEATEETMIEKIELDNQNQKQWFTALLNTQVFHNKNIMDCIEKNYNLCTIDDASRLLTLSMKHQSLDVKILVVKCISNLSITETAIALTRFFRQFGLNNHLEFEDVSQVLTLRLNKIHHMKEYNLSLHELELSEIKEIELILLQNPKKVLEILYDECIKNKIYTFWLKDAFKVIRDVISIEYMQVKMLEVALKNKMLCEKNFTGCVHLMKMLIDTNCIEKQNLYNQVLQGMLEGASVADDCVTLKYVLQIIQDLGTDGLSEIIKFDLAKFSIDVLQKYRIKMLDFSYSKVEICTCAVAVLKSTFHTLQNVTDETQYSPLNKYYIKFPEFQFLDTVCNDFNIENYAIAVSQLLKVLSRCIPLEWTAITAELDHKIGCHKTLEILTDSIICVCEVVNTQNSNDNVLLYEALTYYLQNVGVSMKALKDRQNSEEFEIAVIKRACWLMRYIPSQIRYNEALKLITLFDEKALILLSKDKEFVCTVVAIEDTHIKQVLAKKMIA